MKETEVDGAKMKSGDEMNIFRKELQDVINKHSMELGSDTPDFILAKYLEDCLSAFDSATRHRAVWYKPLDGGSTGQQVSLAESIKMIKSGGER